MYGALASLAWSAHRNSFGLTIEMCGRVGVSEGFGGLVGVDRLGGLVDARCADTDGSDGSAWGPTSIPCVLNEMWHSCQSICGLYLASQQCPKTAEHDRSRQVRRNSSD